MKSEDVTCWSRRFTATLFAMVLLAMLSFAHQASAVPPETETSNPLRVATYNIQFLSMEVQQQGDRLAKLRRIVDLVKPDIVGIQEVADRAAMKLVFPETDWQVVIDDESPDAQDVAFAIRKPLEVRNIPADLDADNEHFLFSDPAFEIAFPNRRDALVVEVGVPGTSKTLAAINLHMKSRLGGRDVTDPRREEAARALVDTLTTFPVKNFVVMGDFNDNPDDRSLNILETGDKNTSGGPEEVDGPFLANLMEPFLAQDMVTHGASPQRLTPDGLVNVQIPGSRERNNRYRGRGTNTGPILFDQLLVPLATKDAVVSGSVTIFRQPFALEGQGRSRPSDHLPVYVDIDMSKLP